VRPGKMSDLAKLIDHKNMPRHFVFKEMITPQSV